MTKSNNSKAKAGIVNTGTGKKQISNTDVIYPTIICPSNENEIISEKADILNNPDWKDIQVGLPKIDKVSLTLPLMGGEDYTDENCDTNFYACTISKNIWKFIQAGGGNEYTQGPKSPYYNVSVLYHNENEYLELGKKAITILIQVSEGKGPCGPHMRIEFNPSKVSAALMADFNQEFVSFTGVCFFDLLPKMKVTRLDVNVDIANASPEDFIIKVLYAQKAQSFFGNSGDLETINYGQAKGTQYTVYNKSREQGDDSEENELLRLECKLKPKVTVAELVHLKNPFLRYKLGSLKPKTIPKKMTKGHMDAFVDSIRYRGNFSLALKRQPKELHNALKYCFKNNQVPEWQPKELWGKHWEQALIDAYLLEPPLS